MGEKKEPKRVICIPLLEGPVNSDGLFITDPQGSYTGVPVDPHEQPVQDADDL